MRKYFHVHFLVNVLSVASHYSIYPSPKELKKVGWKSNESVKLQQSTIANVEIRWKKSFAHNSTVNTSDADDIFCFCKRSSSIKLILIVFTTFVLLSPSIIGDDDNPIIIKVGNFSKVFYFSNDETFVRRGIMAKNTLSFTGRSLWSLTIIFYSIQRYLEIMKSPKSHFHSNSNNNFMQTRVELRPISSFTFLISNLNLLQLKCNHIGARSHSSFRCTLNSLSLLFRHWLWLKKKKEENVI